MNFAIEDGTPPEEFECLDEVKDFCVAETLWRTALAVTAVCSRSRLEPPVWSFAVPGRSQDWGRKLPTRESQSDLTNHRVLSLGSW